MTVTWQNLADGLLLGSVYALMAVGIGLVFGVLRLVNFAYGQLVMAGAFALALASQWGWPAWAGSSSASPSCWRSRARWSGSSSGRCAGTHRR